MTRDGSVEALSSVQDIGTGVGTVIAQTVAEMLGLRPEEITVRIGDTELSGRAAVLRQPHHGLDHAAGAGRRLEAPPTDFRRGGAGAQRRAGGTDRARAGGSRPLSEPGRSMSFAEAAALIADRQALRSRKRAARTTAAFAAPWARRRRRSRTSAASNLRRSRSIPRPGIVRVERVVAVQDCGRPINPLLIESQVQGGVLMGLSYALYENRVLDRATGRMVNANLEALQARGGPREVPAIDVVVLENLSGPERDRRLRHRRTRQHRNGARDRQRGLQRDRRPRCASCR